MAIETIDNVQTLRLTNLDRLDPVTVYMTDIKAGAGKFVMECWGKAWAYYWDGMGQETVREFIADDFHSVEYLANCMWDHTNDQTIPDYEKMGKKIGECICENSWFYYMDKLHGVYENPTEWPTKENPAYTYLKRIITAVKAELKQGEQ